MVTSLPLVILLPWYQHNETCISICWIFPRHILFCPFNFNLSASSCFRSVSCKHHFYFWNLCDSVWLLSEELSLFTYVKFLSTFNLCFLFDFFSRFPVLLCCLLLKWLTSSPTFIPITPTLSLPAAVVQLFSIFSLLILHSRVRIITLYHNFERFNHMFTIFL